jgi:cytochrome c-type biogenesis protein CcmE
MAEAVPQVQPQEIAESSDRMKFIIGGVILLGAVVYLIASNLFTQQEYFMTVDELVSREAELVGQNARISGVVIGDTIEYDGQTLSFEIAHIPDSAADIDDEGGLAEVLHQAANVEGSNRVEIVLYDEPKPDLLDHEAQAIVTGKLNSDGVFEADELLLKCPTRYEDSVPQQAEN